MLSGIMMSVVMLSVTMLNVVAPFNALRIEIPKLKHKMGTFKENL
jgi:hypothetical protein